jgi:uroporphyrinogen decarboxylase
MTSQIDPGSFEMFVTQPAKDIFELIRQRGALSSFFVCGHAEQNIEAMCNCKPDNISIDENIALDYVSQYCAQEQYKALAETQTYRCPAHGNSR